MRELASHGTQEQPSHATSTSSDRGASSGEIPTSITSPMPPKRTGTRGMFHGQGVGKPARACGRRSHRSPPSTPSVGQYARRQPGRGRDRQGHEHSRGSSTAQLGHVDASQRKATSVPTSPSLPSLSQLLRQIPIGGHRRGRVFQSRARPPHDTPASHPSRTSESVVDEHAIHYVPQSSWPPSLPREGISPADSRAAIHASTPLAEPDNDVVAADIYCRDAEAHRQSTARGSQCRVSSEQSSAHHTSESTIHGWAGPASTHDAIFVHREPGGGC